MTNDPKPSWPADAASRLILRSAEGHSFLLNYESNKLQIIFVANTEKEGGDGAVVNHLGVRAHISDVINLDDVIGAKAEVIHNGTVSTTTYQLTIFAYERRPVSKMGLITRLCFTSPAPKTDPVSNNLGHRFALHRSFQVTATNTGDETLLLQDVDAIVDAIRCMASNCRSAKNSSYRYLVMINPMSGTKNALQVYESTVKPMLEQSSIHHDTFVTEYAGHALQRTLPKYLEQDRTTHLDISHYQAIILLGGDGILFEVLQALKSRPDYNELIQHLKFGIVGCGTCNGLAASLLHARKEKYHPLESTFIICKGRSDKLDLSLYHTSAKSYLSFLTFSWGIIADIDIESEKLRFMGALRNDIWALWSVALLRSYKAKFSYTRHDINHDIHNKQTLIDPVPDHWETIEADFILFWASHVSHAAYNVHQSPHSTFRDGLFRIIIVRAPCSRIEVANILLGLETSHHVHSHKVEIIECVAFRLEPLSHGSFNVLDGEVVESGTIQGFVMPSTLNFFQ